MSKPCRCSAYPFPHRALGGKCTYQTIYKHYGLGETESKTAEYLQNRFCFAPCQYLSEWKEHHPYGMGTAAEHLCECKIEHTEDCPIVQRIIQLSHKKEVA